MLKTGCSETSLPETYSQTKIGKLPASWGIKRLEQVTDPSAPIRYGVVQIGSDTPGGVPIVPIKHIRRIDSATLHRASPDIEAAYVGSRVKGGDVLISVKGTIGDVGVVPDGFEGNIAREIARIRTTPKCDPDYLSFLLQADHTQRRIERLVVGSTRLEFSIHAVKDFLIPLPPLSEQRRIAEILRTWDEAIDACERLIEKKQRRLASARQQIFGRNGLPPDKWPSSKLASLVERVQRQSDGEEHPVMTISGKLGFRRQDEKFARFMAGESVSRYLLLKRGEFAYNKGNSKTFPQGCIYRLEQDTALVPFVYFAFALSDDLDSDFYAHLFASGFLNRQLGRLINSGVRNDGLLNIYADDFFGCEVPVPPRFEQERIGQLFNGFGDEISFLERQLEQLRQQKRGLMQKLLTGEWRVAVEEELP